MMMMIPTMVFKVSLTISCNEVYVYGYADDNDVDDDLDVDDAMIGDNKAIAHDDDEDACIDDVDDGGAEDKW